MKIVQRDYGKLFSAVSSITAIILRQLTGFLNVESTAKPKYSQRSLVTRQYLSRIFLSTAVSITATFSVSGVSITNGYRVYYLVNTSLKPRYKNRCSQVARVRTQK